MGDFYYSKTNVKPTPAVLHKVICEICESLNKKGLFGALLTVERRKVPWGNQWLFWTSDRSLDVSFSISLLRDGLLEFKVPRSFRDEHWEDQQKVRRRIVRHFNEILLFLPNY